MSDLLDVEALTERYGPMVLRRCRQLLREEDEALDACQDVFVRLLERRSRIRAQHPSSLLYIMATNVCLNRIRDRGRHATPTDDGDLDRIARSEAGDNESHARLMLDRLFRRQPASSRTMAVLHYVDGLTLGEVANETGFSVSGVRKRLTSLRHVLREMSL